MKIMLFRAAFQFFFLLLFCVPLSYANNPVSVPVLLPDVGTIFEKNEGEFFKDVLYKAKTPDYSLNLLSDGFDFYLGPDKENFRLLKENSYVVEMRFLNGGGSKKVASKSYSRIDKRIKQVMFENVWQGIDLVYYDKNGKVEYDFIVEPGVDASIIQFEFKSNTGMRLDESGNLLVNLVSGNFQQHKPFVYQYIPSDKGLNKKEIPSSYKILDDGRVTFNLASYDKRFPLVMDPVISYSSFFGGRQDDFGRALVLDASGNILVAGDTQSADFPLVNAMDSRLARDDQDIFISKFNPDGSTLLYSTFLGGKLGIEKLNDLAVDKAGNVYVTGITTGADFPVTPAAYQSSSGIGEQAFFSKLDQTGKLVYSSYVSGASQVSIAVDDFGHVYLAGLASAEFKTTQGSFQQAMPSGKSSAPFVLKLNKNGSDVLFSTFISGTGFDVVNDIELDARGNIFLVGETDSNDFPLKNAIQTERKGISDGFITKLDSSGALLLYSSYFGGNDKDIVNAIKLDAEGNMYFVGETYSEDYPVKNAFQSVKAGSHLRNSILGNGFVTKLSAMGDVMLFSSFLGGEVCYPAYCEPIFGQERFSGDIAFDVQLDQEGHAYVIGGASSYTFPLVDSLLPKKQIDQEKTLFVSKLSLGGNVLLYSTFIYLSEHYKKGIEINQAAIDEQGSIVLTGAYDAGFSTTENAWNNNHSGGIYDAVLLKLNSFEPVLTLTGSKNPSNSNETVSLTVVMNEVFDGNEITFWNKHVKLGSSPLVNGVANFDAVLVAGIYQIIATYQDGKNEGDSSMLYQLVNPDLNCQ